MVGAEFAGWRLDTFLGLHDRERSRSHFKKLIQEGLVVVNGRLCKPGHEVQPGDLVLVVARDAESGSELGLTPQFIPLDVLYEDEDLVVVNKAAGVVVHPGAGNEDGTLVHGLLAHCPRLALQGAPLRPGIVHRLDKGTSGALVVAKSERAYLNLIDQFKEHTIHKEYLALVYGRPGDPVGEIRTLLDRHPEDRKRMAVTKGKGREAVSRWQRERDWGEVSLLRVTIETGRTHQIRVHLSHLRHPVVGDDTYGGGQRRARALKSKVLQDLMLQVQRQMLHAWKLAFDHPVTHERICLTAPVPGDFQNLLDGLDKSLSLV